MDLMPTLTVGVNDVSSWSKGSKLRTVVRILVAIDCRLRTRIARQFRVALIRIASLHYCKFSHNRSKIDERLHTLDSLGIPGADDQAIQMPLLLNWEEKATRDFSAQLLATFHFGQAAIREE